MHSEEPLNFASDPKPPMIPRWFSGGLLLLPAGWLLAFGSLLLRVRLVAGEWPHGRSGDPFSGTMQDSTIDPKQLGPHYLAVIWVMCALVYLVPLGALFLGLGPFIRSWRQPAWLVGAFCGSSALAAAVVFLDLGGFMNWLMD